jgi:glycosyltransferase involved in cell wall biosynthesis
MAPVTVCVPAYNAAAFIAETLDSVLAQTFGDLKVLISLDRSTDDSEAICRTNALRSSRSRSDRDGSAT